MYTVIIHMNAGVGCNLLSHWMGCVLNALTSGSVREEMSNEISVFV